MSGQHGLFGESYACLAADPPWQEHGGGKIHRGCDRHYSTMPVAEILHTMQASPAWRPAEDCHLWMWAADNFLLDGLWLIERLGFRYIRTFVWVKMRDRPVQECCTTLDAATDALQIGLGQYARGSHELLLFAVRGSLPVPPPERRLPSVFFAERGEHSRKPEAAFRIIEAVSPGPRVEFFARAARAGWDCWGNEAPSKESDDGKSTD